MVPVVEFLRQKHFQPNFKVYIDDKCTVYKQISYLRLSVNTIGLILLWYMSVVLGILFWEFKLQNIMSWLRDNDKILKIYLENVRYYGQVILWRSSLTCFTLVLKQSGRKNFVIFSDGKNPFIWIFKYILMICVYFTNKYVIWNLQLIQLIWSCCFTCLRYWALCFKSLNF